MNITVEHLKKMKELEIIKLLKNPETSKGDYDIAFSFLLKRYEPMIGKHWYILSKQMDNSSLVNGYKDEYYSMAYEAFFTVIEKVDISKVYDDNFKLMQLLSWYLTNVRNKIIPRILLDAKSKGLNNMNVDEELDITVDLDVEEAYYRKQGYKEDPLYVVSELISGEENCERAIKACLEKWSDREKIIFEYLNNNKNRSEIARIMGLNSVKVWNIVNKMKKDMKKELGISA